MVTKEEPGEFRVRLTQPHAAQGGITLDLEQGKPGSRFYYS